MHEPDYMVLEIGLLVSNVFVSLNVYVVRGLDGFMFHAETSSLHRSIGYIGYLDNSLVPEVEQSEVIAGLQTSFLLART